MRTRTQDNSILTIWPRAVCNHRHTHYSFITNNETITFKSRNKLQEYIINNNIKLHTLIIGKDQENELTPFIFQIFLSITIYTTTLHEKPTITTCIQELYLSVLTNNYKRENHPKGHQMPYPNFLPPYKPTPLLTLPEILQLTITDIYYYANSIAFDKLQELRNIFNNNTNIPPITNYHLYHKSFAFKETIPNKLQLRQLKINLLTRDIQFILIMTKCNVSLSLTL